MDEPSRATCDDALRRARRKVQWIAIAVAVVVIAGGVAAAVLVGPSLVTRHHSSHHTPVVERIAVLGCSLVAAAGLLFVLQRGQLRRLRANWRDAIAIRASNSSLSKSDRHQISVDLRRATPNSDPRLAAAEHRSASRIVEAWPLMRRSLVLGVLSLLVLIAIPQLTLAGRLVFLGIVAWSLLAYAVMALLVRRARRFLAAEAGAS